MVAAVVGERVFMVVNGIEQGDASGFGGSRVRKLARENVGERRKMFAEPVEMVEFGKVVDGGGNFRGSHGGG